MVVFEICNQNPSYHLDQWPVSMTISDNLYLPYNTFTYLQFLYDPFHYVRNLVHRLLLSFIFIKSMLRLDISAVCSKSSSYYWNIEFSNTIRKDWTWRSPTYGLAKSSHKTITNLVLPNLHYHKRMQNQYRKIKR